MATKNFGKILMQNLIILRQKPRLIHEDPKSMTNYESYEGSRPDSNCRTCNDFKSWSKQQQKGSPTSNVNSKNFSTTTSNNIRLIGGGDEQRKDCPLDKAELGRSTWGLLHTMAAFYSDNPTAAQKSDAKGFLEVLSRVYPCEFCAADFRKDLQSHPPTLNSQADFSKWLCEFHNRVNLKLGKPLFDCSKVNERWRDGWLDGSCD